jgi:hypothetical protein
MATKGYVRVVSAIAMEVRLGERRQNSPTLPRDEISNGDSQKNCGRGRIHVSRRSDCIALVHLDAALSVTIIGSAWRVVFFSRQSKLSADSGLCANRPSLQ